MASTLTNVQHNLVTIQAQFQALQVENANLTKIVALKENYVNLKDQQLRVMAQRMEELEAHVTTWRDKCMQIMNQPQSNLTGTNQHPDSVSWTLFNAQHVENDSQNDLVGSLVEKLTVVEREYLQTLMDKECGTPSDDSTTEVTAWESHVFTDVSEDFQNVLQLYMVPLLQAKYGRSKQNRRNEPGTKIQCLSRSYTRCVVDMKIVCVPTESSHTEVEGESLKEASTEPHTSSTESTATTRSSVGDNHAFDCVDRNGIPTAHSLREIHPTKAVYISSPLPEQPPLSVTKGHSVDVDVANDSDRRNRAISMMTGKDMSGKKIKKIMGNMMKGLNRTGKSSNTSTPTAQTHENEDETNIINTVCVCDGCGRSTVGATRWVCRTCRLEHSQDYELCEKCYGHGVHGKEHDESLLARIEEIVIAKCPKLQHEQSLMRLLRVGICKANLKKYSFCLTWIADLLMCKQTKDLRARALEISQISPHVRSEFVRLLTDLLMRYRRDIELLTEWEPVQNVVGGGEDENLIGGESGGSSPSTSMTQLDMLRIWVKDTADGIASNRTSISTT